MIMLLRCQYEHGQYAQEEPFFPHGDGIEVEADEITLAVQEAVDLGWFVEVDGSGTCPFHRPGGGGFMERKRKFVLPRLVFQPQEPDEEE